MLVLQCKSSKADVPFVCCYEDIEYKRALWDLIWSYYVVEVPEVSLSTVMVRIRFMCFTWLTALIIGGMAVHLSVACVLTSVRYWWADRASKFLPFRQCIVLLFIPYHFLDGAFLKVIVCASYQLLSVCIFPVYTQSSFRVAACLTHRCDLVFRLKMDRFSMFWLAMDWILLMPVLVCLVLRILVCWCRLHLVSVDH